MEEDLIIDLSILQSHLDGILDRVLHNSLALQRFQVFERQLLNLNSLSELIFHIIEEGKALFDLDAISFCLVDQDSELSKYLTPACLDLQQTGQLIVLNDHRFLQALFGLNIKPYTGVYHAQRFAELFRYTERKPVSVALIPLIRRGRFLGSLNFGSLRTERFSDSMATDFVEHMVSVVSICLENNVNFETMRRTSLIDSLTGINNRRFLEQRLIEEIDRCQRSGELLSCLFLDVDHFKAINDTFGHQAGDGVLKQVAGTIKGLLRNNDVLARYGGEEFVALLSNLDEQNLMMITERIRKTIEGMCVQYEGRSIHVTISIGASSYRSSQYSLSDASAVAVKLVESADAALYRAKRNGRNRVESSGFIGEIASVNHAVNV